MAGASHGLERGLAVGIGGVPVGRAAHPIGVEFGGAGGEDLQHLGAAEIVLAGRAAARSGTRGETLDGRRERVLPGTGGELVDERPQPVGSLGEGGAAAVAGGVEDRVTGLEQGDPAVARFLLLGEREQSFRECAVGRPDRIGAGGKSRTHGGDTTRRGYRCFPGRGKRRSNTARYRNQGSLGIRCRIVVGIGIGIGIGRRRIRADARYFAPASDVVPTWTDSGRWIVGRP